MFRVTGMCHTMNYITTVLHKIIRVTEMCHTMCHITRIYRITQILRPWISCPFWPKSIMSISVLFRIELRKTQALIMENLTNYAGVQIRGLEL